MSPKNFKRQRFAVKSENQINVYNSEFNGYVKVKSDEEMQKFESMIDKSYYLASFFR